MFAGKRACLFRPGRGGKSGGSECSQKKNTNLPFLQRLRHLLGATLATTGCGSDTSLTNKQILSEKQRIRLQYDRYVPDCNQFQSAPGTHTPCFGRHFFGSQSALEVLFARHAPAASGAGTAPWQSGRTAPPISPLPQRLHPLPVTRQAGPNHIPRELVLCLVDIKCRKTNEEGKRLQLVWQSNLF